MNSVIAAIAHAAEWQAPKKPDYPQVVYQVQEALGYGKDHLDGVIVDGLNKTINLRFGWSARGSWCDTDFDVPMEVFAAFDPTFAAKLWQMETEISHREHVAVEAKKAYENAQEALNKAWDNHREFLHENCSDK